MYIYIYTYVYIYIYTPIYDTSAFKPFHQWVEVLSLTVGQQLSQTEKSITFA